MSTSQTRALIRKSIEIAEDCWYELHRRHVANLWVILKSNFEVSGLVFSCIETKILQENTRRKALAEIYTMHAFAPFSNFNFFVRNRQNFFATELMDIY